MTSRVNLSRVLARSSFYELLQSALGARESRARLVREYVRPRPGDRILDAGCGPASLLEALPEDVAYTGFDPNEDYIRSATSHWGARGQFFVGSVGDPLPDGVAGPFDIVLGVGLLHHLDDDDVTRLCEQVHEFLGGAGTFVTLDAVVHDEQHPLARWLAEHDRGQYVRTPEQYLALVGPHFDSIESSLLTNPLRVPYSHFIMRAPVGPT